MLDYLIILLVGLIANTGGPWWVILVGAIGLSAKAWIDSWIELHNRGRVPLNQLGMATLIASVGNSLIATSVSYIVGAFFRLSFG